ncbi:MAG: sugar nucleotide-binding protein [bacterium]
MKILIIGNGFLGKRCLNAWPDAIMAEARIESAQDVLDLLDKHKPDAVLNSAGVVGKPNVDWCETHQLETAFGNTILPIMIAKACAENGVYLLHMGTGCIFYGDSPNKDGWRENDHANPSAVYTRTKYAGDLVLSTIPNVGIARIRMPIDSIPHPANLIDKISKYEKVVDVRNSVTVVEDMIEVFHQLIEKKSTGIFHVVNPGSISHKEILDYYKQFVDSKHDCQWIGEQDLVELGLAKKKRSNNIMSSNNLAGIGINMRPVSEAVKDCMQKYATARKNILI